MRAVSCAKTAEPIKKRLGMLSRVGPQNMYYMGMAMTPQDGARFGLSGQLTSMVKVKHRILGCWGCVKGVKKTGERILTVCT